MRSLNKQKKRKNWKKERKKADHMYHGKERRYKSLKTISFFLLLHLASVCCFASTTGYHLCRPLNVRLRGKETTDSSVSLANW